MGEIVFFDASGRLGKTFWIKLILAEDVSNEQILLLQWLPLELLEFGSVGTGLLIFILSCYSISHLCNIYKGCGQVEVLK